MEQDYFEIMKRRYPMSIFPVEDEGERYWFAFYPDFGASSCSATGGTIAEALKMLERAKEDVVRIYIEKGKVVPEPSKAPFEIEEPVLVCQSVASLPDDNFSADFKAATSVRWDQDAGIWIEE